MGEKTDRAKQFVQHFMGNLLRLEKYVEEKLPSAKLKAIEVRLNELNSSWEHFKKCIPPYEKYDTTTKALQDISSIEEMYFALRPELEEKIHELRAAASSATNENNQMSQPIIPYKLQDIDLDTFSGDYMKWANFINSFDSLVHENPNLTDLVKFQYLKRSLSGQAIQVIESLDFITGNYLVARDLLKQRFDKHVFICEQHVSALYHFKALEKPCPNRILCLVDHFMSHLRALESLGRPVNRWDDLIVFLIVTKLDPETKSRWIDNASFTHLPTIDEIMTFLRNRAHKLETKFCGSSTKIIPKPNTDRPKRSTSTMLTVAKPTYYCFCCRDTGHTLTRCRKFYELPVDKRIELITTSSLCTNCLHSGHEVKSCPNKLRCRYCNLKHHTLLHESSSTASDSSSKPSTSSAAVHTSTLSSPKPSQPSFVYLGTAKVTVLDRNGVPVMGRALLDSGSQLNFVTESFFKKLQIPKTQFQSSIHGIGSNKLSIDAQAVIELGSCRTGFSKRLEVKILKKITSYMPTHEVTSVDSWSIPANLQLADPDFFLSGSIDLLLGADTYFQLMSIGQIQLGDNLPTLQNTLLGWIVSGRYVTTQKSTLVCHVTTEESENLSNLIEQFWTVDSISTPTKPISIEESECEAHFIQHTARNDDGRYVVKLPFHSDPSSLGSSRSQALKRFMNLERRLYQHPERLSEYSKFMMEYEALGHMTAIETPDDSQPHYYFPHHCVVKPDSSTTKLRVVFDGSAKTTSGKSINDILMVGPVVQNDLYSILTRFRAHRYVFSSDISKMYRQILVHKSQRKFQYILWRTKPEDEVQTFQLNTVTYGTACAPYLATRCLNQLAYENRPENEDVSNVILNDVYVDDLLTGSNTIHDATQIKSNLDLILNSAGMHLRKWCSNSPEIIQDIPEDHREKYLQFDNTDHVKMLGILWQPNDDVFGFNVQMDFSKRSTKRSIFSQIATIYDPLGLITPVVVVGKLIMQNLWRLKLDWDQALPQLIHSEWLKFRDGIPSLNRFHVDRWVFDSTDMITVQIHGFADASERAYGAVLYVKSIYPDGHVSVKLLTSKSRVAPLKSVSLPRLELCAAVLLAELAHNVSKFLNFKVDEFRFWSDSMIVLHWLRGEPSRWKVFVANRVSTIQKLTDSRCWAHVPSAQNPADFISRGMSAENLLASTLWLHGPEFLCLPASGWPSSDQTEDIPDNMLELKKAKIIALPSIQEDDFLKSIKYSNNYRSLQRVVAYILRFKIKPTKYRGELSAEELDRSLATISRYVQQRCFPNEYKALEEGNTILKNNTINTLSPFMDNYGVIRVGGRLHHSSLPYQSKHPMLLPCEHDFTLIMASYFHRKLHHAGPQSMLAAIRGQFWVLRGKQLCTKVFRECLCCFKARPRSAIQKLGNLPFDRVHPSPPFSKVALDYCGPFYHHYRLRGKPPTKTYLCVFICLVTKAIHCELASDLSTAAFMGAFKRFVSTRGVPNIIQSDNGTNFVGANSYLKELFSLLSSISLKDELTIYCDANRIEWNFIPPCSPHFGGLHEAGVKLAKFHLRRTVGTAKLTYEQLQTLVKEIEAILNSRPLTPISNSPDDLQCLTPGHFLIGRPLISIVPAPQPDRPPIDAWKQLDFIKTAFWKRWSTEYLRAQQQRYQWTNPSENINIGDMVLLMDDNIPSLQWRLGRITKTYLGTDGLVRVALIRTATGEYKRAIHKLCKLPIIETPLTFQGGDHDESSINT